jgi:hypothetical protein
MVIALEEGRWKVIVGDRCTQQGEILHRHGCNSRRRPITGCVRIFVLNSLLDYEIERELGMMTTGAGIEVSIGAGMEVGVATGRV